MPSDDRRYAVAGLPAIGIGMGLPATGHQPKPRTPDRLQPASLDLAIGLLCQYQVRLAPSFIAD
jgi:hypothetical protein